MKKKKNNSGFVLIFTLGFLVVMTAAALQFHHLCAGKTEQIRRNEDLLQARFLSRIGAALAAERLLQDASGIDWLGDDWNKETFLQTPRGTIRFTIQDENGKVNLNGLLNEKGEVNTKLKDFTGRLFTILGYSGNPIDCLIDWIDENDFPGVFGAESEYYGTLVPPYRPANRNLCSLRELTLIRGFTPEVLDGVKAEDPEQGRSVPGLLDLATMFSDSKINVNTCAPELLQALGYNEAKVSELVSMRAQRPLDEGTLMRTEKKVYQASRALITTRSRFFSVVSEGTTTEGARCKMRVYLKRDKTISVLRTEYL